MFSNGLVMPSMALEVVGLGDRTLERVHLAEAQIPVRQADQAALLQLVEQLAADLLGDQLGELLDPDHLRMALVAGRGEPDGAGLDVGEGKGSGIDSRSRRLQAQADVGQVMRHLLHQHLEAWKGLDTTCGAGTHSGSSARRPSGVALIIRSKPAGSADCTLMRPSSLSASRTASSMAREPRSCSAAAIAPPAPSSSTRRPRGSMPKWCSAPTRPRPSNSAP
jgi:hypothetical protein